MSPGVVNETRSRVKPFNHTRRFVHVRPTESTGSFRAVGAVCLPVADRLGRTGSQHHLSFSEDHTDDGLVLDGTSPLPKPHKFNDRPRFTSRSMEIRTGMRLFNSLLRAPSVKYHSDCRIFGTVTSVIIKHSALPFIIWRRNSVTGWS